MNVSNKANLELTFSKPSLIKYYDFFLVWIKYYALSDPKFM